MSLATAPAVDREGPALAEVVLDVHHDQRPGHVLRLSRRDAVDSGGSAHSRPIGSQSMTSAIIASHRPHCGRRGGNRSSAPRLAGDGGDETWLASNRPSRSRSRRTGVAATVPLEQREEVVGVADGVVEDTPEQRGALLMADQVADVERPESEAAAAYRSDG
jgi:hypothetical protein